MPIHRATSVHNQLVQATSSRAGSSRAGSGTRRRKSTDNDGHGGADKIDSRFTWQRINQASQDAIVVPFWNIRVTRSYLDNKQGSTMFVARHRKHHPRISQVLK